MSKNHSVPHRAQTIGMWLFLASLSMLFLASMLGYLLFRFNGLESMPLGTVKLPPILLLSTALMLLGSFAIHRSLIAIGRERQATFRQWMLTTIIFAGLFVAVQTPAMIKLWRENEVLRAQHQKMIDNDPAQQSTPRLYRKKPPLAYGLVFFLVLLHAAHVVGGIIGLSVVAIAGFRGKYDHEHHAGVRHAVIYWHFLDVVWIAMYTLIFAFG